MSSISIINKVKYNKNIYKLYNYLGSKMVNLMKCFIRPDDQLIVFASFGGRKFDDSPKAIFDAMLHDKRFDKCKLMWAFIKPEDYELPRGEKVRIDTRLYYKSLLKARVWVTNSSMTRGLNFQGINTFELNTWHGSAIKKMGSDMSKANKSFYLKGVKTKNRVMLAQGEFDIQVFSKAFRRSINDFRVFGLPRNDVLANVSKETQRKAKEALGIQPDKIVILYAPTFREYDRDNGNNCMLMPPIDLKKWKETLGKDHVFLFRAHYEVVKVMNLENDDFVINVSSHPNLNELMIASDMLISDYSSIFFDYSIQGKPMLSFAYDYDRYEKERGMYFDIRKELDCEELDNEDALLKEIRSMDVEKRSEISKKFRDKYIDEYGNASQKCLDLLAEVMK